MTRARSRQRTPLRIAALAALALLALLLADAASLAQPADPEAQAPDATAAAALAGRRAEVQREIADLRQQMASRPPEGSPSGVAAQRLDLLRSIDSLLARSIEERRSLDAAPEPPAPVGDAAPPSVAALVSAYDGIDQDRARLDDLSRAIEAARETSDTAQSALRDAQRAQREAREALGSQPSPEAQARLELASLRARAAQEEVHLRELELRRDRAARREIEQRLAALETRAREIEQALRSAPPGDLDADLVRREGELARREEEARRALDTAELRLRNASSRYASQASPSPQELQEVEALQMARDAATQAVALLEKQRERLDAERELRSRWLALTRGEPDSSTLSSWQDEAVAHAETYRRAILQEQGRLADLQERAEDLQQRQRDAQDPGLRRALEERASASDRLVRLLVADVADLTRQERIQRRLVDSLEEASGSVPLGERLAGAWGVVADFWRYEITSVDQEPITVGNAVLALLLVGLGFTLSRRISRALRRTLDARFRLDPGVAGAAETGLFYVLLVTFALIALRTVNFPLTAFTVAGGALAIGIGFGSQNVMNNFISGLILMLERPIRANDLVEVENTHGVIERIGARSTRIRATDGRHLIVPNSFFLENNVVNWTLSDDLIRTRVSVGVIYGSPTRLVEKLIRQVLDENPKILGSPAPIIVFSEFGDNSLNFDAYFWTRARGPMAVNQLGGEVRFRIDDLFREHDLVIAFPQRDVHLDSASPIEVRLLGDGGAGGAPGADEREER